MNSLTNPQSGLSAVIALLQKQKEELAITYHTALTNGEKLHEIKTIYISLKDADKRLNELMRICITQ
ncbi:MAG: hypothetical protein ABI405_00525 [Parafilimonas sp.]